MFKNWLKDLRRFKIIIRILYFYLFFCCSITGKLWAGSSSVIGAIDATGHWKKGVVTGRGVVYTDQSNADSEIIVDVPEAGKYQLFAYVHHNWRSSVPCIYAEAVDSAANRYEGYHRIENIWYLKDNEPGRWFFVCLSQNPYWNLPKGKLSLKFWAEGNKSTWDNTVVPMEKEIAIENFFLIPVKNDSSGGYLIDVIDPESGGGKWHILDYHPQYATNLIETNEKNASFSCKIHIPVPSYYQGWLSILSLSDNKLELIINKKGKQYKAEIDINGEDKWKSVPMKPLYLDKGEYVLTFKNLMPHGVYLDFLILLPVLAETNPGQQVAS